MTVTLENGEVVNEEIFTIEEIDVLRLAVSAIQYLAQEEMKEADHTETAEAIINNAPVILRKLNRMIDGEEIEETSHPFTD